MTPFSPGQATVYGGGSGPVSVEVSSSCLSDVCNAARSRCGSGAYAEIMLDRAGAIADVVCYSVEQRVVELGTSPRIGLDDQAGTMIVFDSVDDGPDLYGDITIGEGDVVLFGTGARVSVIGGALVIEGGGVLVRGIRVTGDVRVQGDGAKLSLVEIGGELFIDADDVTVTESLVRGRVHVSGSRALLVRNLLGDGTALSGAGLTCNLNQYFDDSDADGAIERAELGGEISCR